MSEQFGHEIKEVYIVQGEKVAKYLENSTTGIRNHRKMINIRKHQIVNNMRHNVIKPNPVKVSNVIRDVFTVSNEIELITEIRGILTSNKLWELYVSGELGHRINPE